MPLTKEEHNEQLEKLLNPDLEQKDRTEILQLLREDYGTFHSDFETVSQEKEKAENSRLELLESNSQLFRKLGSAADSPITKKEEEVKNFSETITVSAIEKGLN